MIVFESGLTEAIVICVSDPLRNWQIVSSNWLLKICTEKLLIRLKFHPKRLQVLFFIVV